MRTCGDRNLSINPQAHAILHILSHVEPTFSEFDEELRHFVVDIKTYAWYAGRENGVALVVRRSVAERECLVITFGEQGASDMTFVEYWTMAEFPANGPRLEDREACETTRKEFPPFEYNDVIQHITCLMSDYCRLAANAFAKLQRLTNEVVRAHTPGLPR